MQLRVLERVGRIRWIFLPVGMCALTAVGAHAAADVVGDRVLWCVDRVDAFFDAIFASWSVTAPLVDLVGLSQRTFFERAVAVIWELVADALIAVPLLGYQERDPAVELQAARILLRKKPTPQRLVRPLATLLVAVAGACAVARMVQGSVQLAFHSAWLSHLTAIGTLFALLLLLVPRACVRPLEHADAQGRAISVAVFAPLVLLPLLLPPPFPSHLLPSFR